MWTTAAQEWPAIHNQLSPSHRAQIAGAKATACTASDEDGIKFSGVIAMNIDDRVIVLQVLFYQTNPLPVGRLSESNIHKNLLLVTVLEIEAPGHISEFELTLMSVKGIKATDERYMFGCGK